MAAPGTKFLITQGLGLTPGDPQFLITRGLVGFVLPVPCPYRPANYDQVPYGGGLRNDETLPPGGLRGEAAAVYPARNDECR